MALSFGLKRGFCARSAQMTFPSLIRERLAAELFKSYYLRSRKTEGSIMQRFMQDT